MTYEESLAAHVRKYDRLNARLREILIELRYDNDESPEVRELKRDIAGIISSTFLLKQCHTNAISIVERESKPLST